LVEIAAQNAHISALICIFSLQNRVLLISRVGAATSTLKIICNDHWKRR